MSISTPLTSQREDEFLRANVDPDDEIRQYIASEQQRHGTIEPRAASNRRLPELIQNHGVAGELDGDGLAEGLEFATLNQRHPPSERM